jgi:uncharacterized membrane protein YhaH (DUF805 family)
MNWYLKCLKQYADFSGRARRKEYWMYVLFYMIIAIVVHVIDVMLGWVTPEFEMGVLGGLYSLCMFIPGLAVSVRRLHDIGKSGWNFLFILIPLVGAVVLLIWFCKEGERRGNAWGLDPKIDEV